MHAKRRKSADSWPIGITVVAFVVTVILAVG